MPCWGAGPRFAFWGHCHYPRQTPCLCTSVAGTSRWGCAYFWLLRRYASSIVPSPFSLAILRRAWLTDLALRG
jgi:hypothetical protein